MKKAIVLGGTSPHVELINKLKKRGYYTILVDYFSDVPGVYVADCYIQESTLNIEKVLEIAESECADLVISTCIDQANSVCCYVAEKLDLPKPYSYQTSLDVTDKGRMKKIMIENEIPTSSYIVVASADVIEWDKILFPVVVKPVDCNSSKGVRRADTKEEVIRYVQEDISYSKVKNAIIESYCKGEEIQVDCFVSDSCTRVLMTRQKKKIQCKNGLVLQSTGSIIPAPLSEELKKQVEETAVKIASSFKLKNTPFFYQAIVTEQGISVLEFAPRIGGGLSYYLLKEVVGIDSVEIAIDSFLGIQNDVKSKELTGCYSTSLLYMRAGTFAEIRGMEKLKAKHIIKEYFQTKKTGTVIDNDIRSGNRVGAFVVQGKNFEEVRRKELEVFQNISVLNNVGDDMLMRELY